MRIINGFRRQAPPRKSTLSEGSGNGASLTVAPRTSSKMIYSQKVGFSLEIKPPKLNDFPKARERISDGFHFKASSPCCILSPLIKEDHIDE